MLPISATKVDEINQSVNLNLIPNHWPNLFSINAQSINSSLASLSLSAPFLFSLLCTNSPLEKSSVPFQSSTGSHAPTPLPAQARLWCICGQATQGLTPSTLLKGVDKHCSQQCSSCCRPASFFLSSTWRGLSLTALMPTFFCSLEEQPFPAPSFPLSLFIPKQEGSHWRLGGEI